MQFVFDNLFWILLLVCFITGRSIEKWHFASIRKREQELQHILTYATRYPPDIVSRQDGELVFGCAVISSDYFKQFVAGLRNLVGGRFHGYETLIDRARREAILRMKENARAAGYQLIVNVKLESTSIAGGRQGSAPAFELFAYGTALRAVRSQG